MFTSRDTLQDSILLSGMAPFSLSSEMRESVKASMDDRPLDMMVGPPTTEKMDAITEQLAKSMAGVRINATE